MPAYVTVTLAVIGIACLIAAIVYFAEPAGSLPSFFPGHQAGSNHHHSTHGIVALIVGLIGISGAWMSGGRKKAA